MKVVASYPHALTAHMARQHLKSAGIQAFVLDEHSTSNLVHGRFITGGVKVAVAQEDAQRAARILGTGVAVRVRRCPRCGSDDVRLTSHAFLAMIVFAFTLGLLKPQRLCYACAHTWRGRKRPPSPGAES